MAEDVHEQGVGADGAVELAAGSRVVGVVLVGNAAGGGVGLGEASCPGWICEDGAIGGGVKVAVSAFAGLDFVRLEQDAWETTVGGFMGMKAGMLEGSGGELAAESGGGQGVRHGWMVGEEME